MDSPNETALEVQIKSSYDTAKKLESQLRELGDKSVNICVSFKLMKSVINYIIINLVYLDRGRLEKLHDRGTKKEEVVSNRG